MPELQYEKILITGATSGIGEALAYQLAKQTKMLILSGRNEEKLQKLSDDLKALTVLCDLSIPEERKKLTALILEKQPDLVINCAGYGLYGNAADLSITEQLNILKVDGEALLDLTLTAIQMLQQEKAQGTIVNVSSVAGFFPFPGFAVYSATKAFVTTLSKALYYELKDQQIAVLAFCPGPVKTNFRTRAAKKQTGSESDSLDLAATVQALLKQIETKRSVVIYNWKYRLFTILSKFIPTQLLAPILHQQIRKIYTK